MRYAAILNSCVREERSPKISSNCPSTWVTANYEILQPASALRELRCENIFVQ
jgi:hypothetical protein